MGRCILTATALHNDTLLSRDAQKECVNLGLKRTLRVSDRRKLELVNCSQLINVVGARKFPIHECGKLG